MKTAHLGQKVRHDFSRTIGEVTQIRQDPKGYNFYVVWEFEPERSDWYKLKVLEPVEADTTDKGENNG